MRKPPIPPDENRRLEALHALNILDTPPEERFDRVTRLARRLFDVPIALISFVDANRLWIKSKQGIDATEFSRDISFCAHAILDDSIMVVKDTLADERFFDNPFVVQEPQIRFYAACPLKSSDGSRVGTLCLIDRKPRNLSAVQIELLTDLAAMVQGELHALELATVDPLTGLTNRLAFEAIAHHSLALSLRADRPVTLLFIDLNGLKTINDRQGHTEGDRVILEMSRMLLASFRDSDVIARIGGDEFCILMSGASESDVQRPLADLQEKVDERNLAARGDYDLSFSVGIATYDANRHASVADLIEEADQSMYRDKRRNHHESDVANPKHLPAD